MGNRPNEALTEGDTVCDIKNPVWWDVVQLAVVEAQQPMNEAMEGKPKPPPKIIQAEDVLDVTMSWWSLVL